MIDRREPTNKVNDIVEDVLKLTDPQTTSLQRRNERYDSLFSWVSEQGLVQYQVRDYSYGLDNFDPESVYLKAMFLMPKDDIWKDRAMKID